MPTFGDEIDRTIDDVAREMTAGQSPSDLRARVLARIDTHLHERPYQWHPALAGFLWTIAAVAAALIIAIVLRGGVRLRPDATNSGATAKAIAPGAPTATATATPTKTQIAAPTKSAARSHKDARTRGRTPYFSEVAALAPPRLHLESISLDELDPPPSIQIEQLEAIAPIAIAPLSEGDRP
jgi:hypothetical protein